MKISHRKRISASKTIRCGRRCNSKYSNISQPDILNDDEVYASDYNNWRELASKSVVDSDGFYTDYTLYTNGSTFICMFGDKDIYKPDEMYADYETENEADAYSWFDNYEGFSDEEDEVYSASNWFAGRGNLSRSDIMLKSPINSSTEKSTTNIDAVYSSEGFGEYEDDIQEIDQEFTSENTSINSRKLPAIFKMIDLEPGTINIDYGGGRFDNVAEYLAPYDIINLVYDPYNRSKEHNREVIKTAKAAGGADTATCSNVLNVIKEPEVRLNVLNNIKKLVKPGGTVYITVYEGSGKGDEGPTKSGYQLNRRTADYLEEIQQVFPDARRKGKLIVATNSLSVNSSTEISLGTVSASITAGEDADVLWDVINDEEFGFSGVQDVGYDSNGDIMVIFNNSINEGMIELTAECLLTAFQQYGYPVQCWDTNGDNVFILSLA